MSRSSSSVSWRSSPIKSYSNVQVSSILGCIYLAVHFVSFITEHKVILTCIIPPRLPGTHYKHMAREPKKAQSCFVLASRCLKCVDFFRYEYSDQFAAALTTPYCFYPHIYN